MVIVLVGSTPDGTGYAAGALARQLGWSAAEAHRTEDLRQLAERALGRREGVVIGWADGTVREGRVVLDGLRPVRFVAFQPNGLHDDGEVPGVPQDAPLDTLVDLVRSAFGV